MNDKIKISKINNNGMTVAVDEMPEVDSVIVQVAVPVGSQNELVEEGGISHFLEHMAFKGTEKRTYKQISEEIDNVGGITNACTSKGYTMYYIKALKKDVEMIFDVLSDMLFCSSFPQEEIEKERGVIIQEKAMCEDEPSCVNEDLLYLKAYGDTSFGRPIIGTVENIKRFSRDDFINYRAKNYKTNEMIIGVCGNVKNENIQDLANKYFSKHEIKNKQYTREKAKYIGGAEVKFKKDLEQIKFSLGFNGIVNNFKNITHENLEKKYAMKIGSMILGAGMSSRLFQEIREKRGLVYYIHTMTENYSDTSLFTVNAGFSPDKIHEFVPALKDELIKICREISDCELNRAINQLEASFLMQLEKSSIRVDKIVDDLMLYNKIIDKDEILNIVKNLTKKQIMNAMASLFSCKPTLAVYGNVDNEKTDCLLKEFGEKL